VIDHACTTSATGSASDRGMAASAEHVSNERLFRGKAENRSDQTPPAADPGRVDVTASETESVPES
jgi:hypothetical protein